jgi:hypothetical protein
MRIVIIKEKKEKKGKKIMNIARDLSKKISLD